MEGYFMCRGWGLSMGPFLFLPGPQVYSGEHGQGAKTVKDEI